jgi:hypothetical protein
MQQNGPAFSQRTIAFLPFVRQMPEEMSYGSRRGRADLSDECNMPAGRD